MGLLLRHRWLFYFRQVLPGTGGYCLDSAEVLYPHRRVAAGGAPVAQLANEVPSPSPGDGLSGVLNRQPLGQKHRPSRIASRTMVRGTFISSRYSPTLRTKW
jgi:hypothetical protein